MVLTSIYWRMAKALLQSYGYGSSRRFNFV